jgi:aryl-alcohol dehydrogenase (NADP+)
VIELGPLSLGTATFGGQCDEATARAILDRAAAAGVRCVDTADVYPMTGDARGASEEILGRWLHGRRDAFILATKGGLNGGNGRASLTRALDGSLKRLRTDHVDVDYLHAPDPQTPLDDALETLAGFVAAGKVLHVGGSNFGAKDAGRFEVLQTRMNLLYRDDALLDAATAAGTAVVAYNPLAGGLLTGKHGAAPAPGSRFALEHAVGDIYRELYWSAENLATVERLRDGGREPATLAIQWLLDQPAVTSVVLGATRPDHLDATLRL